MPVLWIFWIFPVCIVVFLCSAMREWCLAFHDVRANVLEIVSRWDDLQHMSALPAADRQIMALEALQIFAPLGHALGLGKISSQIEDICFKASYFYTGLIKMHASLSVFLACDVWVTMLALLHILQVIFPASYDTTSTWLRDVIDVAEESLFQCQQQLLSCLDDNAQFKLLASGCVVSH